MTYIAGSIAEASLGNRIFQVVASCDAKIDLGGYVARTETIYGSGGVWDRNGRCVIAPDPNPAVVKTSTQWSIEDLEVAIDTANSDLQWLYTLRRLDSFGVTITLADDSVYGGTGIIVGAVQYSTRSGTAKLSLSGTSGAAARPSTLVRL